MKFNRTQKKILNNLLDREIDNYKSVKERTGRDSWDKKIQELQTIKAKLK